ncbi:MAG: methylglutaconyl-CoA hydratase LiuC [Bacteroidetes bacterium HLUCCA01]|nr:MAG: methylglutaconyl-CoA hydratase LiuC [Bacteroidetes bacterium HLUCCA01]
MTVDAAPLLLFNVDDGIASITLNRPEKRNALSRGLVEALHNVFQEIENREDIRAVLLTGAGEAFSAGADLAALKQLQSATYQENLEDSQALAAMFQQVYRCSKPVIGAINGHAIAGGCGLATLCDITIAADTARFGYTETRIGFVPALVSRFVLAKIGETQARRLLLSGILIDAQEAAKIGLVTECVPEHAFQGRVDWWCEVFRHQVSPQAVSRTLEVLREVPAKNWNDALRYAAEVNARARGTEDCKKGIAAFLNKEPIRW